MKKGGVLPAAGKRSDSLYPHEEKVLLVLTLIIGAVVGLVVVLLSSSPRTWGPALSSGRAAAWRRLVFPSPASLSRVSCSHRYFPNARGSGIPQTKTALFLRDGYISFRTVLGKFGLCSVSLASGIALGREGPSVHVGAGIASSPRPATRTLARQHQSAGSRRRTGALAAAFNTPIPPFCSPLKKLWATCTRRCSAPSYSVPPRHGSCFTSCWAMSRFSMFPPTNLSIQSSSLFYAVARRHWRTSFPSAL